MFANQAQDFLIFNLFLFWLLSLAQNYLRKPKELSFVNYFWSLTLQSPSSSLIQLIEHSRRPNFTFRWATLILLESWVDFSCLLCLISAYLNLSVAIRNLPSIFCFYRSTETFLSEHWTQTSPCLIRHLRSYLLLCGLLKPQAKSSLFIYLTHQQMRSGFAASDQLENWALRTKLSYYQSSLSNINNYFKYKP